MFGISTSAKVSSKPVEDATKKAGFKNFAHAAARITKDWRGTIVKSDVPSAPGQPPHTRGRGRHNLKGAGRFDATATDAVSGALSTWVGESASAHEFGKVFKGVDFEERPFLLPALERNVDRFAQDWAGSIT